jgi:hypothetical protein
MSEWQGLVNKEVVMVRNGTTDSAKWINRQQESNCSATPRVAVIPILVIYHQGN